MNAKTFVVQHEWDNARSSEVIPVVSKIIGDAKARKLPKGFDLVGVVMSKEAPRAYCVWRAENKLALEQLIAVVNPPTRHTVAEFDPVYGLTGA